MCLFFLWTFGCWLFQDFFLPLHCPIMTYSRYFFLWSMLFSVLLLTGEPSLLAMVILQILVCLSAWLASPMSCQFLHVNFKSILEFLLCILNIFFSIIISVTSLAYCLSLLCAKQQVLTHFRNSIVVGLDCWRDLTFKFSEHLIYEKRIFFKFFFFFISLLRTARTWGSRFPVLHFVF